MTKCIVCQSIMHTPRGLTCSIKCSQDWQTKVQFIYTSWKVPIGDGLKFFDVIKHNADRREYIPWKN